MMTNINKELATAYLKVRPFKTAEIRFLSKLHDSAAGYRTLVRLLKYNYSHCTFVTCADYLRTAYCIHLPQNLGERVGGGYEGLLFQPFVF